MRPPSSCLAQKSVLTSSLTECEGTDAKDQARNHSPYYSPFSSLGCLRKLALHMCAVSLKVLPMDTLYFMKSVSGTESLENDSADVPATQPGASKSLLSLSLLPLFLCLLLEAVGDCSVGT